MKDNMATLKGISTTSSEFSLAECLWMSHANLHNNLHSECLNVAEMIKDITTVHIM